MKSRLKPKLIGRLGLAALGLVALGLVGTVGLLKWRGVSLAQVTQHPGTLSECSADGESENQPAREQPPGEQAGASGAQQRPVKVVVKPWAGRHHVYGVFILPDSTSQTTGQATGQPPYITINIPGRQTYCAAVVQVDPSWVGLPDRPGQQVVIGLLHTRTAWWLLGHGQKADLQNPENWSLRQRSGGPAAVKAPDADRSKDAA
jgi:hypothetical protein